MTQKSKAKKPVKVKAPQAPPLDLTQMQIQLRADNSGIYITIIYQGHAIHAFVLSVAEYQLWQRLTLEQKVAYVRSRTNSRVFGNNRRIVGLVVKATVKILNEIFARARAQQAQAQRRTAQ